MSANHLALLPDLTHYEISTAPILASTVLPFLNGESRVGSWAEAGAAGLKEGDGPTSAGGRC